MQKSEYKNMYSNVMGSSDAYNLDIFDKNKNYIQNQASARKFWNTKI